MKLPESAHTDRPWRIHALAPDFECYDVWALPTPGGPDDFPRLVEFFAEGDTGSNPSPVARALFKLRWKLGELFGWDDPEKGVGARLPTLRDRLPADLRQGPTGPGFAKLPFKSVYLTDDEWAAEMGNRTVHAVMHLSWVPTGAGGAPGDKAGAATGAAAGSHHGQMAVLVKPNGVFGRAYMAAIAPLRHLVVYPPLMRGIAQEWQARAGHTS